MLEGKRQQAIDAFSKAIKSDPDCKKAYVSRAMLYNESNRRDKALADYSKAIDLDPTDNYALAERAKIYERMGRTAEAPRPRPTRRGPMNSGARSGTD